VQLSRFVLLSRLLHSEHNLVVMCIQSTRWDYNYLDLELKTIGLKQKVHLNNNTSSLC